MGMFDSVMVPCPSCGEINEFQSKSGDCTLDVYSLDNCPLDVIYDINRHSPIYCQKCGVGYRVDVKFKYEAIPVIY